MFGLKNTKGNSVSVLFILFSIFSILPLISVEAYAHDENSSCSERNKKRHTYYRDADGDGYGNPSKSIKGCTQPDGYVSNKSDCDDRDPNEHPHQVWYKDYDNDGYSNGTSKISCERPKRYKVASELVAVSGDCNDTSAAINPGATDTNCNGIDENCSGIADDGYAASKTSCGIGVCASTGQLICVNGSTQDTCVPGSPTGSDNNCNGVDEDCDGGTDDGYVSTPTFCGTGICASTGQNICQTGSIVNTCTQGQAQTEGPFGNTTCDDSVDNDCDGLIDAQDPDCACQSSCPSPEISQVVNSASLMPIVAPDSLASVIGNNLAEREVKAGSVSTTELDGVTVSINGRLTRLILVSPERIDFLVPSETEIGQAEVIVTASNYLTANSTVTVQSVAPGLFISDSIGYRPEYMSIINPAPIALSTSDDLSNPGLFKFALYVTGIRYANLNDVMVEVIDKSGNVSLLQVESIEPVHSLPGMEKIILIMPPNISTPGNFEIKALADFSNSNSQYFYIYNPNELSQLNYILATNMENNVFVKSEIQFEEILPKRIILNSAFLNNGILLTLEPSGQLRNLVFIEINYKDVIGFEFPENEDIYLFHFDLDGLIEPPVKIESDPDEKVITLTVDKFSNFYIGAASTFNICNNNCNIADCAFKLLVEDVDRKIGEIRNLMNNSIPGDGFTKCSKIRSLYEDAVNWGWLFGPKYDFGRMLLADWLSGAGYAIAYNRGAVTVSNRYFDDLNKSSLSWRKVWEEAANLRASTEAQCSLSISGLSGSLSEKVEGKESTDIAVHKYDLYTSGSYDIVCRDAGKTQLTFDISVQARDRVDFISGSMRFIKTFDVCGERIIIEIPDYWGQFITDGGPGNCSQFGVSPGKDYNTQGSEELFRSITKYADQCSKCSDDRDNDGIPNDEDNCPDNYNPNQDNNDGDDKGDVCDPDDDNDGLPDDEEPEACRLKADCDGDGIPDGQEPEECRQNPDCDGDGIPDGQEHPSCRQNPDPKCNIIYPDPTFIQFSKRDKTKATESRGYSKTKGLIALLSVPYNDALVRGDVPIFGIASGDNFKEYRVEVGEGKEPTDWTTLTTSKESQKEDNFASTIASASDESIRGNLATWDTGLKEYVYLPSHPADHPVDLKGVYTVRLVVEGTDGSVVEDRVTVEVANVISNAWGGEAASKDGIVRLSVPEQALMDSFRLISIKQAENPPVISGYDQQFISKVYEVRELNEQFTKSATLQFSLPDVQESSLDPGKLGIYGYNPDDKKWIYLKSERFENSNIVLADIKHLYPFYVVMMSNKDGEGSVVKREPDVDKRNILTRNSGSRYLVNNTFESSLGEWSNRDGNVGATVSIVDDATYDSTKALKITNTDAVGNFAVNVISSPFDVREYPIVQFDYRIASDVKTNVLVKTAGKWYEIGFTGEKKDLKNNRVNIAHIGDIDNVVTDDKWHTVKFNLYNMLRTKTGNTAIEEMIMANWDVSGYMRLSFGHNQKNAAYYIDNFVIAQDITAGFNIDENMIIVDNFNQKKETNSLGGSVTIFGDSKGGKVLAAFSTDDAKGKGNSLELSYDIPNEGSYAGYASHFQNLDLRDFKTITFQIKGLRDNPNLLIGLLDQDGKEHKLPVSSYVSDKVGASWQLISVPLVAFSDAIDLSRVNGMSLSFEHGSRSAGLITIDDISFDKNIKSVVVDNFEKNNESNLLAGKFWTFAYGDSAINSNMTRNSPNRVMKISYGGNIGQIYGHDKGYNYAGWTTELNGIDCSHCDILSFRIKGAEGGENPNIYLSDGNFRWSVDIEKYAHLTKDWQQVIVPLNDFAKYGVDLSHLSEIQIVFEWEKMSGTIYLDDIVFGK